MKNNGRLKNLAILFLSLSLVVFYPALGWAKTAKHIILVIGDGMSLASEVAASRYLYGRDQGLSFHDFPYQNFVTTWDLNLYKRNLKKYPNHNPEVMSPRIGYDFKKYGVSPYPLATMDVGSPILSGGTDSAAAATAMATGYKTDSGNVSWVKGDLKTGGNRNNDGTLKTIAELFRENLGASIGIVSSVPFSHATPAAFVSHNLSRSHYYSRKKDGDKRGIADEIVFDFKPEVVLSGGHHSTINPNLKEKRGYYSRKIYDFLKNSGEYILAERKKGADGAKELHLKTQEAKAKGKRLFGIFGGKDRNIEHGKPSSFGNPRLFDKPKEDPTLAQFAESALKVLTQDKDGFFLMIEQGDIDWANHKKDYRGMIAAMMDLEFAVQTIIDFVNQPRDDIDWDNTLLIVTSDHGNGALQFNEKKVLGRGRLPLQWNMKQFFGRGWKYPFKEVSYHARGHTNELVSIYARGVGVEYFKDYEGLWYPGTRLIDNTHIFHVMKKAAGL